MKFFIIFKQLIEAINILKAENDNLLKFKPDSSLFAEGEEPIPYEVFFPTNEKFIFLKDLFKKLVEIHLENETLKTENEKIKTGAV